MRISILTSEEDLDWLFDVHLQTHPIMSARHAIAEAILYGNEDWPSRIEFSGCVIEPVYNDDGSPAWSE